MNINSETEFKTSLKDESLSISSSPFLFPIKKVIIYPPIMRLTMHRMQLRVRDQVRVLTILKTRDLVRDRNESDEVCGCSFNGDEYTKGWLGGTEQISVLAIPYWICLEVKSTILHLNISSPLMLNIPLARPEISRDPHMSIFPLFRLWLLCVSGKRSLSASPPTQTPILMYYLCLCRLLCGSLPILPYMPILCCFPSC